MSQSNERMDKLLGEWFKIKAQKSLLEKRESDIKELVNDIMRNENKKLIQTDNFYVSKISQRRSGISQRDVPEDVWNRYAKKTEFSVFKLKRLN